MDYGLIHTITARLNSRIGIAVVTGILQHTSFTNFFHSKKALKFFYILMIVAINGSLYAQNYPPAQGPPNTTDPGGLPTFAIFSLLDSKIQQVVDDTNAKIKQDESSSSVKAHISFTKTVYQPGMSATTFTNQPNQRIVRIALSIKYTISNIRYHGIPYFSRNVYQSITVNVSCNNWFIAQSNIKITANIDPPYLDSNSFAENVLNFFFADLFSNNVDNRIRSRLPAAFQTINNLSSPCSCLGVDPGTAPGYEDGEIRFSYVAPKVTIPTPRNTVTVRLQSIKRLRARNASGGILYDPEEDIQLVVYANQNLGLVVLDDMKEEEERALEVQAISIKRPSNTESLVLIANIVQSNYQEDSRFIIFNEDTNFGNGVQTIIIRKSYWERSRLPDGSLSKPIERKVNAYELKLKVEAFIPEIGWKNVGAENKNFAMYEGNDFSVYPNPLSGLMNISYRMKNTGNITITIRDSQGNIVRKIDFERVEGLFNQTVNVSSLNSGLYYLEMQPNNGTSITKRFVKK